MRKPASVIIVCALFAVSLGAIAIASNDSARNAADRDASRAAEAAVKATDGGTVRSVDRDRERGATWEVEVTRPNSSSVEVLLDQDFRVVDIGPERNANRQVASETRRSTITRDHFDSEEPVPAADADRAAEAALDATGGGTVQDVDRDSEGGATWEVEVRRPDGSAVDVLLDARFNVISVGGEQEPGEGHDDETEDDD